MEDKMNLNQMDFDKWRIINNIKEDKGEDCEDCNGTGYVVCENITICESCGYEIECHSDLECEECNGTGIFDGHKQDYKIQHEIDFLKIYYWIVE